MMSIFSSRSSQIRKLKSKYVLNAKPNLLYNSSFWGSSQYVLITFTIREIDIWSQNYGMVSYKNFATISKIVGTVEQSLSGIFRVEYTVWNLDGWDICMFLKLIVDIMSHSTEHHPKMSGREQWRLVKVKQDNHFLCGTIKTNSY